MIVGYITLAFPETVNAKTARQIVDEIAGFAIDLNAIDAVKCDIGELGGSDEAEFWREAEDDMHPDFGRARGVLEDNR